MSGQLAVPENAGIVATLVRGSQVVTIHKPGTPTFAVRAVVRLCDRYGWRVRCLSSPATIYRDLDGSREAVSAQRSDMYLDHGEPPRTRVATPEQAMLAKIGRTDVLA